jgi:uncharacterized membrane protein YoaK (UPF0700 family)
MRSFLTKVRDTLLPPAGARHGPLPPLLVGLTMVTGLVEAFSYLVLGHVFVANMTGNVVFLGFALAGAPGFSLGASLTALAAFWPGALAGGRMGARLAEDRGRLLGVVAFFEALLVAVSVILAAAGGTPFGAGLRYPLIVVLAVALGMQNATARRLAVPDLTTTVLTLTITGTAADSSIAGGHATTVGRRVVSVTAMFIGALVGAAVVLHVTVALALGFALGILLIVAALARRLGMAAPAPEWIRP